MRDPTRGEPGDDALASFARWLAEDPEAAAYFADLHLGSLADLPALHVDTEAALARVKAVLHMSPRDALR
jgi:hypothetical protein